MMASHYVAAPPRVGRLVVRGPHPKPCCSILSVPPPKDVRPSLNSSFRFNTECHKGIWKGGRLRFVPLQYIAPVRYVAIASTKLQVNALLYSGGHRQGSHGSHGRNKTRRGAQTLSY